MFFRINNTLGIQYSFREQSCKANLCDKGRSRLMGGASKSSAHVHIRKMHTGRTLDKGPLHSSGG
jgi:hypothetical protein